MECGYYFDFCRMCRCQDRQEKRDTIRRQQFEGSFLRRRRKQMAITSPTKPGIWWLGSESAKKEQQ